MGQNCSWHTNLKRSNGWSPPRRPPPPRQRCPERRVTWRKGRVLCITFISVFTSRENRKPVFEHSHVSRSHLRGPQPKHPWKTSPFVFPASSPGVAASRWGATARGGGLGAARRLSPPGGGIGKCSIVTRRLICLTLRIPVAKWPSLQLSPPFLAPALPLPAAGTQRGRPAFLLLLSFLWFPDSRSY